MGGWFFWSAADGGIDGARQVQNLVATSSGRIAQAPCFISVHVTGERKPTRSRPTNGLGTGCMGRVQIGLEIIT